MKKLAVSLMAAMFAFSAVAATKYGVTFKDNKTVEGKNLVLNGIGLRKKLVVKVYVGALYLEQKTTDADSIINSNDTMQIVLHFLRETDASSISSAFLKAYQKNCGAHCRSSQRAVDEFLTQIVDAKIGDRTSITVAGNTVKLHIKGDLRYEVSDSNIATIVKKMFLGDKPANRKLRDGMLGL